MIHRESSVLDKLCWEDNLEINSVKNIVWYDLSRHAIDHILDDNNIKNTDKVLVPEFMCHTLIEVIRHYTHQIISYKLNDNLNVDCDDLIVKIRDGIKLVFIVDYFGVKNKIDECTVKLLQERNIIIVRDMAHSFLTLHQNKYEIDNYSDYVFSSIYKSLKLYSGAILVINKNSSFSYKSRIGVLPIISGLVKNIMKKLFFYFGIDYIRLNNECSNELYFRKITRFNVVSIYKFFFKKIDLYQVICERNLVSFELYRLVEKSDSAMSLFDFNQISDNTLQAFPIIFNTIESRNLIKKSLRKKSLDAYTWPHPHCLFNSSNLGDRILLIPVDEKSIIPLKEELMCLDM